MLDGGQLHTDKGLSGKKILVTGASGFIGAHLCRRLQSMESEIVGVSRQFQKAGEICTYWVKADLKSHDEVKKIVSTVKPDIIFHLASHVVGARDLERVMPTFQDNLASTVNLLVEATDSGCDKIVLVGSLEEPEISGNFIIPSSPYAAAKFAASAYGRMFHALYDTPLNIARLFMVYGPGQRDLKKLIPFVIRSLLKKQMPTLTSGKRLVDWIYVEDVVDALVSMAHTQHINGETIDVGSGELNSVQSVVMKISELIDPSVTLDFGGLAERPMEQVRVAGVENTFNKIGWKPTTDLIKGLNNTIRWYADLINS